MYDLVLQIILFASLGVIVYLMARAVPRIPDAGEPPHARDWFDRLLTRLPLHQIDAWINARFEKFLRRAKVIILKIDNLVARHLHRLRKSKTRKEASQNGNDLFGGTSGGTKE